MASGTYGAGDRLLGEQVAQGNGTAFIAKVQVADATGTASGTSANPTVFSEGASAKTDRSITASTTSQQAAAANTARKKLFFQNLDAAINVHINIGAVATTGSGSLRLAPGASLELSGTSQTVNVIAASGTPLVTIWEF